MSDVKPFNFKEGNVFSRTLINLIKLWSVNHPSFQIKITLLFSNFQYFVILLYFTYPYCSWSRFFLPETSPQPNTTPRETRINTRVQNNRVNKYRGVKYKCTRAFEFAEG